jgi:hypothetical protein
VPTAQPENETVDEQVGDHVDDSDDSAASAAVEPEPLQADEDDPFRRRDADLTPLIVSAARKLKRVLADEQNGVLDELRRQGVVRDVEAILPAVGEHATRYAASIADDLLVAAHAGASLVCGDQVASLPKREASAATSAASQALSEWLIAPLRDRLTRCILEGDGDTELITKRMRAVYREWKTQHIDAHLDDVVRVAHGRGVLGAIEAGTPVSWVPDDIVEPCADCNDNVLAGAVPAGDEFPTGHTFAPPHPGCRCLLLPIAQ